jgi:hypothetical protein
MGISIGYMMMSLAESFERDNEGHTTNAFLIGCGSIRKEWHQLLRPLAVGVEPFDNIDIPMK